MVVSGERWKAALQLTSSFRYWLLGIVYIGTSSTLYKYICGSKCMYVHTYIHTYICNLYLHDRQKVLN